MNEHRFKECVMPLHKTLYSIAFTILRDECDAKDCLQEAFTKLWENRGRLDEIDNVAAYASVTIRNIALSFSKSRHLPDIISDPPPDLPDSSPSPQGVMEARDDLIKVERILNSLPENQRRVIKLTGIAGMSAQEIRKHTGLSEDNIRVILSRGRKKIKELFLKSQNI